MCISAPESAFTAPGLSPRPAAGADEEVRGYLRFWWEGSEQGQAIVTAPGKCMYMLYAMLIGHHYYISIWIPIHVCVHSWQFLTVITGTCVPFTKCISIKLHLWVRLRYVWYREFIYAAVINAVLHAFVILEKEDFNAVNRYRSRNRWHLKINFNKIYMYDAVCVGIYCTCII